MNHIGGPKSQKLLVFNILGKQLCLPFLHNSLYAYYCKYPNKSSQISTAGWSPESCSRRRHSPGARSTAIRSCCSTAATCLQVGGNSINFGAFLPFQGKKSHQNRPEITRNAIWKDQRVRCKDTLTLRGWHKLGEPLFKCCEPSMLLVWAESLL